MHAKGYESLSNVFLRAFEQASAGKGSIRHSDGRPFDDQPMLSISSMLGSADGLKFQAIKKTQESRRLDRDAEVRELLGAINYLAGAVIWLERTTEKGREPVVANHGEKVDLPGASGSSLEKQVAAIAQSKIGGDRPGANEPEDREFWDMCQRVMDAPEHPDLVAECAALNSLLENATAEIKRKTVALGNLSRYVQQIQKGKEAQS